MGKTNKRYGEIITECLIDGKRMRFNACSTKDLKEAKKDYKHIYPNYIGSGHIWFHNEEKEISKKLTHFFKK